MMTLTDQKVELSPGLTTYSLPRVNLLPQEILDKRSVQSTRVAALGMVATSALCVVGWAVWANADAAKANDELAVVQTQTVAINRSISELSHIPRFVESIDKARQSRTAAMSNDILWYKFFNDLAAAASDSVWLKTMTMSINKVASSDPLAPPGVGSIAVTGQGRAHTDVADWLDKLDNTTPFSNPVFSNSTMSVEGNAGNQKPIVNFTSTASIVPSALSGRYDKGATQ